MANLERILKAEPYLSIFLHNDATVSTPAVTGGAKAGEGVDE